MHSCLEFVIVFESTFCSADLCIEFGKPYRMPWASGSKAAPATEFELCKYHSEFGFPTDAEVHHPDAAECDVTPDLTTDGQGRRP